MKIARMKLVWLCLGLFAIPALSLYGNFYHMFLITPAVIGILLLSVFALVGLIKPTRQFYRHLGVYAIPCVCLISSYPVGSFYKSWIVAKTERELLVVDKEIAEETRKAGSPPANIDHLLTCLPWATKNHVYYTASNNEWSIAFSYFGAFLDLHILDPHSKTWTKD